MTDDACMYAIVVLPDSDSSMEILGYTGNADDANAFCAMYGDLLHRSDAVVAPLPIQHIPGDRNQWARIVISAWPDKQAMTAKWIATLFPVFDPADLPTATPRIIAAMASSRDIVAAKAEAVPDIIAMAAAMGLRLDDPPAGWMESRDWTAVAHSAWAHS